MPSPFIHAEVAAAALTHLDLPAVSHPAYLFGSTAPDADKLLGLPRSVTHFWDSTNDVSGALKLLHAYPHLASQQLGAPARAFVAGYLCHLVTDEQWTLVIYRRYFGRYTPYGGRQEGIDLQLALQSRLERRRLAVPRHTGMPAPALAGALTALAGDELPGDLLPFLPTVDLWRWRDALVRLAALPPGVQRYRLAGELMPAREQELAVSGATGSGPRSATPAAVIERRQAFLKRLPALQAQVASYVAPEAVAEFAQRAVAASTRLVGDYLAGRWLSPPEGTTPPDWPAGHAGSGQGDRPTAR